jgi:hypothetical protein
MIQREHVNILTYILDTSDTERMTHIEALLLLSELKKLAK